MRMFTFDIDYTNEEYMEYYKDVLITRKIVRNIIFILIFVAIAVIWWVDKTDATKGNFIPIFALVAAVILPLSNLLYIPLLKRQLRLRENEVKNVHLFLTFEEDKIIYENKTEPLPPIEPVEAEEKDEQVEKQDTQNEEVVESKEDIETSTQTETEEEFETEEEEEKKEPQKVFTLHYNNFYEVTSTKNLIMMALDRQTVIIIPKRTIQTGTIDNFIQFLSSKIYTSRFKIKGVKSTYVNAQVSEPIQENDKNEESQDDKNQ